MKYEFILPLSVILPRKTKEDKKIMLNLNVYRNLHHAINNQVKQLFLPIEWYLFKAGKIKISYKIQKKTKRKFDTMNIISVVDKFFLDWLVKMQYIPDDTFNNVSYGSIDGKNDCEFDRVIAEITVIK
jgi:hypothetical protein